MSIAPVALFAYKRPEHLWKAVTALRGNPDAARTLLYVFSDGAKRVEDQPGVAAVRKMIEKIDGFAETRLIARDANLGLARSIIDGVGRIVQAHGRAIVVEHDLVVSPFFLQYMNEALDLYAGDDRVASVHGYVYPTKAELPETFFLRGADCWGWGTWARAWRMFEPDGTKLLGELRRRKLTRRFDMDGTFPYTRMLEEQIAGANDSWAIRWHAAAFLADCLTLYPGRSLVQNIGFDGSGTHCGTIDSFSVAQSDRPIEVSRLALKENTRARARIVRFARARSGSLASRVRKGVRQVMVRILPSGVIRILRRMRDGNRV